MWANAAAWLSTFSCLNKNLATFSLRSISRLALTASLFLELKLLSVRRGTRDFLSLAVNSVVNPLSDERHAEFVRASWLGERLWIANTIDICILCRVTLRKFQQQANEENICANNEI